MHKAANLTGYGLCALLKSTNMCAKGLHLEELSNQNDELSDFEEKHFVPR